MYVGGGNNEIDPPTARPSRPGLRYSISHRILGKLERLAKARFEIHELTEENVEKWLASETYLTIVQSVNASSEIEGEHVTADQLSLEAAVATKPTESYLDDELAARQEAIRSIYQTYVWALATPREPWLSYEFLLELHRRMFQSTKPSTAGQIKKVAIQIRGGGYLINTLPAAKTEEFLRALCERTNDSLNLARRHSEASMFLAGAEFVLDFLAIHPFEDGNGRTARLLSTYLLERSGYHFARFYPLDQVIVETRDEYYPALFKSQLGWYTATEDLTSWIEYYTDAVFMQWTRAYQRVRDQHSRRAQ
jgi:Fic family protein